MEIPAFAWLVINSTTTIRIKFLISAGDVFIDHCNKKTAEFFAMRKKDLKAEIKDLPAGLFRRLPSSSTSNGDFRAYAVNPSVRSIRSIIMNFDVKLAISSNFSFLSLNL